jgi:hypothetical protein
MGARFVETLRDLIRIRQDKRTITQQQMWLENAKAQTSAVPVAAATGAPASGGAVATV